MTSGRKIVILLIAMVAVYIVFSLGYIVYKEWKEFKIDVEQRSFLEGRNETIEQVIQRAQNESCEPFAVFSLEKEVSLINVECLQIEPTDAGGQ